MDNGRLGYPGISQQERLYPFGIEERSPISKILTNSTGIVKRQVCWDASMGGQTHGRRDTSTSMH